MWHSFCWSKCSTGQGMYSHARTKDALMTRNVTAQITQIWFQIRRDHPSVKSQHLFSKFLLFRKIYSIWISNQLSLKTEENLKFFLKKDENLALIELQYKWKKFHAELLCPSDSRCKITSKLVNFDFSLWPSSYPCQMLLPKLIIS